MPSVRHCLLLLKCSPSLREFVLCHLFGDDILDDLALISRAHSEGSIDTNSADFKLIKKEQGLPLLPSDTIKPSAKHALSPISLAIQIAGVVLNVQGLNRKG